MQANRIDRVFAFCCIFAVTTTVIGLVLLSVPNGYSNADGCGNTSTVCLRVGSAVTVFYQSHHAISLKNGERLTGFAVGANCNDIAIFLQNNRIDNQGHRRPVKFTFSTGAIKACPDFGPHQYLPAAAASREVIDGTAWQVA